MQSIATLKSNRTHLQSDAIHYITEIKTNDLTCNVSAPMVFRSVHTWLKTSEKFTEPMCLLSVAPLPFSREEILIKGEEHSGLSPDIASSTTKTESSETEIARPSPSYSRSPFAKIHLMEMDFACYLSVHLIIQNEGEFSHRFFWGRELVFWAPDVRSFLWGKKQRTSQAEPMALRGFTYRALRFNSASPFVGEMK